MPLGELVGTSLKLTTGREVTDGHSHFTTLYTSNMDVGCSQWGFEASTMTPQHHTGSAILHFP